MSATYPTLGNDFPDKKDTMARMSDLNYANKSLADQYYVYLNAGNFTAAQQLLSDNPTLDSMILNAEKINRFNDIALSLEWFFKDDVESYLETRFAYIGTYNTSVTYVKGNIVDLNGEGFICRVDSSVGVSPTAHITTTNWAIIASQGIQGASGTGLSPRGEWSNSTTYYKDDCVVYNNALWQCLIGNTDSEPILTNSNWLRVLSNSELIDIPHRLYMGV